MVQLPTYLRRPVFALRAFNIESVLVGDQIHSKEGPLISIRFQWWRDAVDAIFKGQGAPKHPVIIALQSVIQEGSSQRMGPLETPGPLSPILTSASQIKKYNLKRILDTRETDLLDPHPPLSIEGLERYSEGSASQLLYLQLSAAGVASREADHAASHLGKAVGITTLLRGTAFHASNRRSYLPLDLCAELGVSQVGTMDTVCSVFMNFEAEIFPSTHPVICCFSLSLYP
jgi:NADH dehydrogenase [ubiquinone] 1 alpha subcomplex assembly factor 6